MDRNNLFLLHVIVWVKLSSLHNTALLQDSRGSTEVVSIPVPLGGESEALKG